MSSVLDLEKREASGLSASVKAKCNDRTVGKKKKIEMLHLSHLSSVYLCKHNKSAELIIAQPDGTSCDADLIRRSVEQDGGKAHVAAAG